MPWLPGPLLRPSTLVLAIVVASLPVGCSGGCGDDTPKVVTPPVHPAVAQPSKGALGFRLSDADGAEAAPRASAVATAPLSAEETAKLLARLPPRTTNPQEAQPFALRPKSIPAPRPGETIPAPFPPPEPARQVAPPVQAGVLHVTRHEPDGNVPVAPYLTVGFDAPMVPVTSHADLDALPVPVKLTPEPPGKWRWIGTQTAMFQPVGRFPMATEYTVDVEAGTKAATGAVLADAQRYRFATPPPTLAEHGPNTDAAPLDPLIYAAFDQAIDPAVVFTTTVVTQGGKPVKVRLATEQEMDADEELVRVATRSLQTAPPGGSDGEGGARAAASRRLLALKPVEPLASASDIVVKLTVGTKGLEGPRATTTDQSFTFKTHGPLRALRHECYGCNPTAPLTITYSNSLEPAKFDKSWVTVSPPIPDMQVNASGTMLFIQGRKKGRTAYKVTVAKSLTDIFGQSLEADDVHSFDVGSADPMLFPEQQALSIVDPGASQPTLTVYSVNEPSLHLRLYRVTPDDYPAYERWRRDWDYEGKTSPPPGALVVDRPLSPQGDADDLIETKVDLRPALKGIWDRCWWWSSRREPWRTAGKMRWVREWLQVTHIGLDVASDSTDRGLGNGARRRRIPRGRDGEGRQRQRHDRRQRPRAPSRPRRRRSLPASRSDLTFLPGGAPPTLPSQPHAVLHVRRPQYVQTRRGRPCERLGARRHLRKGRRRGRHAGRGRQGGALGRP